MSSEEQQRRPVQVPSYGFDVKEGAGEITITVPERKRPSGFAAVTPHSAVGCSALILIPIMALCGGLVSESRGAIAGIIGAIVIGLVGARLIAWLLSGEFRRQKAVYGAVTLEIRRDDISVNRTVYDRAHVASWTIRSIDPRQVVTAAVGSPGYVAAASVGTAIGAAAARKQFEQSYSIGFDYGDKQVIAVGGMTEAQAARLMEAIEVALAHH
jgi:hypothetical protein